MKSLKSKLPPNWQIYQSLSVDIIPGLSAIYDQVSILIL